MGSVGLGRDIMNVIFPGEVFIKGYCVIYCIRNLITEICIISRCSV